MSAVQAPRVTIGIPTYNRAASTLPLTLDSALRQTHPDIEILVADNASTDDTARLVQARQDPRLRYLRHSHNICANDNFNFCLEQARGEYFLLLHDDDLVDPDFVDCCLRAAGTTDDVGLIRTGLRVISQDGTVRREIRNRAGGSDLRSFVAAWFAHKTSPYCCNTLLHTATLRDAGGFRSGNALFQDVLAHVRVAATRRTVNVGEVKASVRRHEGNMGSSAAVADWCDDSRELLEAMCALLPDETDWLRPAGEAFFARMNYLRALKLPSWRQRAAAYRTVSRCFRAGPSALRFALRHEVRPRLQALMRRLHLGTAPSAS